MLISSCVDAKLRKSMTKTIKRLGAVLTTSPKDFTVFVTLEAAKGQKDRGFIKSLNTLSALASGVLRSSADVQEHRGHGHFSQSCRICSDIGMCTLLPHMPHTLAEQHIILCGSVARLHKVSGLLGRHAVC